MTKKRLLALLLTLLLCASAAPALAEEEVPTIGIAISDAVNVEDFETNTMTLMLEEACGVDLTFDVYPSTDYNSKINMMISAGGSELPDVILVGPSDAELISWIESGVLLPITEYCYDETLAPNLHKAMERTGVNILQQITMYDGEIYGIPRLNQSYTNEYPDKAYYNMEWLEQLGMSAPTTADELYELLVKVKETDLNGNGIHDEIGMVGTFGNGYEGWFNYCMSPFVYTGGSNYLTVEDGVIGLAYTTEEWKEGLKFIRKLFEEGLIPQEILTQDGNQYLAMLNSAEPTTMMFFYMSASRVNAANEWRNVYEAVPPLNGPDGEPISKYAPSTADNGNFFITRNCENPEAAFRVGDMMVSEYFSIVTRWGEEGVDWDYVENVEGADQYVPWVEGFDLLLTVYDDATFWSSGEIQNRSWMQKGPYIREYGIANGRAKDPATVSIFDTHTSEGDNLYQIEAYRPDEYIPKLIYSADEIDVVADIQTTLNDFVREWTANFMAGNMDIDENWDAFQEELKNIGVDEYLEIVQAVYDRMYK